MALASMLTQINIQVMLTSVNTKGGSKMIEDHMITGWVEIGGIAVLAEYEPGERWNGWLCPRLDPCAAVAVLIGLERLHPGTLGWTFRLDGALLVVDLEHVGSGRNSRREHQCVPSRSRRSVLARLVRVDLVGGDGPTGNGQSVIEDDRFSALVQYREWARHRIAGGIVRVSERRGDRLADQRRSRN